MTEFEYPLSDERGTFCYRILGGKRVKIYQHLGVAESMKLSGKFNSKKKISKKEYGRLAHLIDSNPKKWKKGYNYEIIDGKLYYFNYVSYNMYEILFAENYEE